MFAHRFGIYKFHTYLFTCTSVRQTCPHREAVFFTLLNPDAEEAFIIQSGMLVGCLLYTSNNGPNSLHGGPTGFHARVWDADQLAENIIQFNYVSADGEEGFPGNLEVEMVYRLEEEENALVIEYRATTDKATVVNLTNHGFFNLAGISNPTPTIENNIVTINANFYTPIDEVSIPTGEVAKVEGTPMDFTTPHTVGERINDKFQQLINGAGYDHCYVLNKIETGSLDLACLLYTSRCV